MLGICYSFSCLVYNLLSSYQLTQWHVFVIQLIGFLSLIFQDHSCYIYHFFLCKIVNLNIHIQLPQSATIGFVNLQHIRSRFTEGPNPNIAPFYVSNPIANFVRAIITNFSISGEKDLMDSSRNWSDFDSS